MRLVGTNRLRPRGGRGGGGLFLYVVKYMIFGCLFVNLFLRQQSSYYNNDINNSNNNHDSSRSSNNVDNNNNNNNEAAVTTASTSLSSSNSSFSYNNDATATTTTINFSSSNNKNETDNDNNSSYDDDGININTNTTTATSIIRTMKKNESTGTNTKTSPPEEEDYHSNTTVKRKATHILNVSTYKDLLDVIDLHSSPHYCGYFKCYYSTKSQSTTTTGDHNRNIGLILSQEHWIPKVHIDRHRKQQGKKKMRNNETTNDNYYYFDILMDSYKLSIQIQKEFPLIKSLLTGPPIQLNPSSSSSPSELSTMIIEQYIHKLNFYDENNASTNIQKGDFPTRRIYEISKPIIIQEVYELPKIHRIQIKYNGQRTLTDFMKKHILPNIMLNYDLHEQISIELDNFVMTLLENLQETQRMILKYPMMGEDFQLFIDSSGRVYQTDWDRIYFTYSWLQISYDPIVDVNNHTKAIEYLLPYLDELMNIAKTILKEYNLLTINQKNRMISNVRKKVKAQQQQRQHA